MPIDYSKLLSGAKNYAKSKATPENLLKAATKFQGKQMTTNKAAINGQTEAAPSATATATSSTMTKYLPYIVAAIAIVIVIFVMKRK
jgi:hypothetical protein